MKIQIITSQEPGRFIVSFEREKRLKRSHTALPRQPTLLRCFPDDDDGTCDGGAREQHLPHTRRGVLGGPSRTEIGALRELVPVVIECRWNRTWLSARPSSIGCGKVCDTCRTTTPAPICPQEKSNTRNASVLSATNSAMPPTFLVLTAHSSIVCHCHAGAPRPFPPAPARCRQSSGGGGLLLDPHTDGDLFEANDVQVHCSLTIGEARQEWIVNELLTGVRPCSTLPISRSQPPEYPPWRCTKLVSPALFVDSHFPTPRS